MRAQIRPKFGIACAIGMSSFLAACNPDLPQAINQKFPKISIEQEQERAVDTALTTLDHASGSNVIASLTSATLANAINSAVQQQAIPVKALLVDAQKQFVWITLSIDTTLSKIGNAEAERKSIGDVDPHISGQLLLGMSVESNFKTTQADNTLTLHLLPAIKLMKIDSVTLSSGFLARIGFGPTIDVTPIADVIVGVLNNFSDRIAGIVRNLDVMSVRIPTVPFSAGKIDQAFVVADDKGDRFDLKITADAIQSSASLASVVWLADAGRITVLGKLNSADQSPDSKASKSEGGFDAKLALLKSRILDIEKQNFNIQSEPAGDWAGISKALIASLVNASFSKSHASLHIAAQIAKEEFSKKVSLPNGGAIDCTPTKDCTPTQNCDLHVDQRDCSKCLVSTFGHCNLHGNDPICEASKGTQNVLYATQKANCEAAKSTAKATCEAEKTGAKTLCEGGKEIVNAFSRTGNFANIDGSFGTGSAAVDISFNKLTVADALDKLSVVLRVSAQGTADTHLKFTPLDIVGHLACQVPWTNDKRVTVTVPSQTFSLTGTLQSRQNGSSVSYSSKIVTSSLVAQMNPSPRDLILSSYNMTLSCLPIAPLIHTLNLSAAEFIPVLQGIIPLPGQTKELSFDLKPIEQIVVGLHVTVRFNDTGKALLALAGTTSQ